MPKTENAEAKAASAEVEECPTPELTAYTLARDVNVAEAVAASTSGREVRECPAGGHSHLFLNDKE